MRLFKWTRSRAVFVPQLDDEHEVIFREVNELQQALARSAPVFQLQEILHRLIATTEDHFAHEEKLMRHARYLLFEWHRKQHDTVRNRLKEYAPLVEAGDAEAGAMLVDFLTGWLNDHVGVTDRMMGAFLRNYQRANNN